MNLSSKDYLKSEFGIDEQAIAYIETKENEIAPQMARYDEICEYNSYKVLKAFRDCGVSARHFLGTTGYGYSDEGREKMGELFAQIFGAEAAIVSPLISSGTQAISTALFGILRPGDTLLCITGTPYDTLKTAIGLESGGRGTLKDFGIGFSMCALKNGAVDIDASLDMLDKDPSIKVVYIQRSRGYELRPSITVDEMAEAIAAVKAAFPDKLIVVDNCYGEFCEKREPTDVGADVMIGSLIKNPGAGIAPTGAYIAGKCDVIEMIGERQTCPGLGTEIGSYAPGYLPFFQGIYFAPGVVRNALYGATLTAAVFAGQGYDVFPAQTAKRADITQAITMRSEEGLVALVRAVQKASPVDSFVVPYPWDMPGYQEKVIMAAGSFIQGSSIEISADGPLREPYVAYFQGGLTRPNIKLALLLALKYLGISPAA